MSDDPIQQMQALEAQNRINEETTLELVAQNQLYNLNNEILVKQDQLTKFRNDKLNQQLKKLKELESNIINKDRIIEQTNQVNENNNKNIYTLYIGLFFTIILFIAILLYSLGKLNDKIFMVIFSIILFIFICLVLYTYNIAHFATLLNFFDNRRRMKLLESVSNIGSNVKSWLQTRTYGDKQEWVDENCTCPETNNVYMEEENIGVNIVPGYFYYDKNAPKQNIQPDGGEPINLSTDANKKIYDKISWVNHDSMASSVLAENDYNIEPNDNRIYKNGKFNADSTYTVNL